MESSCPLVSLCVVARNEEEFIPGLLSDIEAQGYPHERMEVVLVDSLSTDRTKEIMQAFVLDDTGFWGVKVLENERVTQAAGWNVAIEGSSGEVVIRVDAHASIPCDFVEMNVEVLSEGYSVCGGPRPTIVKNPTPWKETLHLAEESAFGSTVADYRKDAESDKNVSSVFHGAYRRTVFDEAGLFDERLRRTEDNELHYRIRQKGYEIRYSLRIRSAQYARHTLKGMIKQKYGNGFWIGKTLKIAPKCVSTFHLVPFAFVVALIACLAVGFAWSWVPLLALCGLYLAVDLSISVLAIIACRKRYAQMLALPLIFPAIHLSYGWGTLRGIFGLDGR